MAAQHLLLALFLSIFIPINGLPATNTTRLLPTAKNWLNGVKPLIVGGSDAAPGEFPWQVSFQERLASGIMSSPTCGGTIIDDRHIVTAGHCLQNLQASDIVIVAGAHYIFDPDGSEQVVNVASFQVHSEFDPPTYRNDIAVLTLSTPLTFTSKVRAISMAAAGSEPSGNCITTGWGNIRNDNGVEYPDVLQKVTLSSVDINICKEKFEEINPIVDGMTCFAGDKQGPCNGDSGGPLVCRNGQGDYYLAGVVSWGLEPCAKDPYYPSVFASVGYYRNWIQQSLR